MIKIILLDMDGVLVEPGGYRAALRATVQHFIGHQLDIQDEMLVDLENRGITSEWDMSPLLIASSWEDMLSRQPMPDLPSDVSAAAEEIHVRCRVDAPTHLEVPEITLVPGQYPSESAFRAGCFASIPYDLRKNLLTGTRNIRHSQTMQIFQQFALGSRTYIETYQLPAKLDTESFLLTYDKSNIDDESRSTLRQAGHYLVGFTSRPSAPPRETVDSNVGYAPEAELALKLSGLTDIPLIAFGKLEYLARQYNIDPATLVKPSLIHALAGILAAWTGDEWLSLQAANHWRETGSLNGAYRQLPKAFELIVLEDTLAGIRSVRSASELLNQAGYDVNFRPLGLTCMNPGKASVFEQAGVSYFQDWKSLIKELA
jgi:hypothetical protein